MELRRLDPGETVRHILGFSEAEVCILLREASEKEGITLPKGVESLAWIVGARKGELKISLVVDAEVRNGCSKHEE